LRYIEEGRDTKLKKERERKTDISKENRRERRKEE
jgi:hypothetical protein